MILYSLYLGYNSDTSSLIQSIALEVEDQQTTKIYISLFRHIIHAEKYAKLYCRVTPNGAFLTPQQPMISSQSHGSVYDRVIGKGIRHDQMHQRITCISALDLKQKTRFQIREEKKMYVQHPYNHEGNIMQRLMEYSMRSPRKCSNGNVCRDIEMKFTVAVSGHRSQKKMIRWKIFRIWKINKRKRSLRIREDKKWKRKTKRCEILDCAFSANSDGLYCRYVRRHADEHGRNDDSERGEQNSS